MPALATWWRLDLAQLAPDAHHDAVAAIGAALLARLDEPHRRYHTSQHVVEMFWALEDLERGGEIDEREGALARLATWFHDAVYAPAAPAGQNEADSAALAARDLRTLHLTDADIDTVRRLVDATVSHESPDTSGLQAAFTDADLWILAAPPERFDEYCQQVREEYAAVPDDAFAAGRASILEPFLHRDSVYATRTARREWETRARENLSRELDRIR